MCSQTIDIPPEFEPAEKFRGTLGHKVNHKFDPTTRYIQLDSARFGIINAVSTTKAIAKDEEFFVSYGYSISNGPPWYREVFKQFKEKNPDQALTLINKPIEPNENGEIVLRA